MRERRVTGTVATLAVLAVLSACGAAEEDHVNRARPPASVNLSAAIIDGRVLVSPRRVGAGPIRLIVTNQSRSRQALTFASDELGASGSGASATTAPIDPSSTATLELDARPGRYAVRTADDAIEPATVSVGAPRPSSQDAVSQP